jgi:hypothetical protein
MIIVIISTCLSLLAIGIAHGMSNWEKVKKDWPDYRCNPFYMPVAGWIRPDVSPAENFTYCSNAMAGQFWKLIVDQIQVYFGVLGESLGDLAGPLGIFRMVMGRIRGFMLSFMSSTISKAAGSMSVFVYYLTKIRDVLKRFVAEGYIGAFLVQTIVDFIWSFVTLFISILKTFVYILLAISFILALFNPALLVLAIVLASLIAASGF